MKKSVIEILRHKFLIAGLMSLNMLFIYTNINSQNLLSAPQKIVIDAKRNRLLVSNFDNGHIVQIDSAGNQTYFIKNANFVDGLEIVGDTIYGVGNNRNLRAYNLITKQLVFSKIFTGTATNYLSSVTYDSSGNLFISCPKLNEIYKMNLSNRTYTIFAKNNGLIKPNGILLEKEKNRIIIIDDSPNNSIIHAISLIDSTVTNIDTVPFNSPDGIIRDKYGYYYIGGYYLPAIYMIKPNFSAPPTAIFSGSSMVYPTYDSRDNSIYITHYDSNSWEKIPLATKVNENKNISEDFFLYQCSPNPFNSGLTIKFDLYKLAKIKIDVFNNAGNLVKTLMNEEKNAGNYSVEWKTNDNDDKQVVNGMYFFRIYVNEFVKIQKAILIK